MAACLRVVIASSGLPKPVPRRSLTSVKTRVLVQMYKHARHLSWCSAPCSHTTVPRVRVGESLAIGLPPLSTLTHIYAAPLCLVGGLMEVVGPTAAYGSHKVNLFGILNVYFRENPFYALR
jgi:hypothetical protein